MGVLVSRCYRIYSLWNTWFKGVTGYMVYGTPGFKVLQDIWFMGHLVSRCYRIYGLWDTWFQGVTGYMVYGTPGFKVYQDMWFYGFMGHLVARKISFPRLPSLV